MKKLLKIFGALFVLLLAAIVIIPFVVDVDQYRPQLVQVVNENINGKFNLGKLSLSLWGQIRVQVDGVDLKDAAGKQVVSVKDAYFHLPFTSILSGSPQMIFKMQTPVVNVLKNKAGKLNVMSLMKPSKAAAATEEKAAGAAPPAGQAQKVALPAIATRARLGVEFRNAVLNYEDQTTALTNQVKDFNLVIRDISLSRAMTLEMWADLDTKMGKTMEVKGPFRVDLKLNPEFDGADFKSAQAELSADFDKIEVLMPGLFQKKSSVPANIKGVFRATTQGGSIESFTLKFHNAEIGVKGSMTNPDAPTVKWEFASNDISMAPWAELVPMLAGYELGGSLKLQGSGSGPADKMMYQAQVGMKDWTAKAPNLKAKPVINGEIKVITDQVEKFLITMKAPGNDLKIDAKVIGFTTPKVTVAVTSTGMDLDQLVNFPPPEKKSAAPAAPAGDAKGKAATVSAPKPGEDYDAMLEPLRTNASAKASSAVFTVGIKMLKAYGIVITDIDSKMTFRDLVGAIEKFNLKVFKGTIANSMSVDLKPKRPTYKMDLAIKGLDLKQAVTSQLELFKNTVYGIMTFSMKGSGASFNPDTAKMQMDMRGALRVTDATFATVDVAKMTSEALSGSMDKIGSKVPALKGKSVKKLPNRESKYEYISSDFTISGGKFKAPNFEAKAAKKDGVDIKGDTTMGLIDYALNAKWWIVDTHDLTGARAINVNVSGNQVDHVLAKGNDPVSFPVTVGCTAMAPCYSYTEVGEHLGGIAAANVAGAMSAKAKAEAKKVLDQAVKQAPAPAQKAIDNVRKKFGI